MYLQFHSAKEPSKNHDIWVRVLFGSLRGRVQFSSGSCTFLLSCSGSGLDKTWVLVRFVLAGFGFFFVSKCNVHDLRASVMGKSES